VFCFQALGANLWLAASVAVATAIVAMQLTKTAHPPGGATALIAVIGGERVCDLGYYYVLMPVATGAFILLFVAVIVNNLSKKRTYPLSWF
jgi:CBS-domain-containing membrane protein